MAVLVMSVQSFKSMYSFKLIGCIISLICYCDTVAVLKPFILLQLLKLIMLYLMALIFFLWPSDRG